LFICGRKGVADIESRKPLSTDPIFRLTAAPAAVWLFLCLLGAFARRLRKGYTVAANMKLFGGTKHYRGGGDP